MTRFLSCGAMLFSLAIAQPSFAAVVNVVDNPLGGYFDVFYRITTGGPEFSSWNLNITPTNGGLLDPIQSKRADDTQDGADLDTWANSVISSLTGGGANYIFHEYHPGQTFPPIAPQSPPTSGASPPNPDQLRWTIFDTNNDDYDVGDTYHMARVMYTVGGRGNIDFAFFEDGQTNPAPGGTFVGSYGVPEPGTFFLASFGLAAVTVFRRSKSLR